VISFPIFRGTTLKRETIRKCFSLLMVRWRRKSPGLGLEFDEDVLAKSELPL
jgi:hypothetical protein